MGDTHEQVTLRQMARDELRALEIIPGLKGTQAHGSAFFPNGLGGRSGRELQKWIFEQGRELAKEGRFYSTRRTLRGVRVYARGTPVDERYKSERKTRYRISELDDDNWLRVGRRIVTGSGATVARAVDERAAALIIRRCRADGRPLEPGETHFFVALAKWLGLPIHEIRGEVARQAIVRAIEELRPRAGDAA